MTEADFYFQGTKFLIALSQDLQEKEIALDVHWDVDHICYRTSTQTEYADFKNIFSRFSTLLIESDVNGRPIATFKLNKPLILDNWQIHLVELPAPKEGKVTQKGFEHVEVVCDVSFKELKTRFPQVTFDEKGLSKTFNQELEMCLGERNIKFHHLSLESVITLEKHPKAWKALQESKVLALFRDNNPLVVGTFPLGIETSKSDVDILMESSDLDGMERLLTKHFSHLPNFVVETQDVDELQTLICHFDLNDVPFELFVQNKETVKQTAHRHFLIEERFLKIGGSLFKEAVMKERNNGLKTEPAYAKVLNLNGNSAQLLLDLQLKSNTHLVKTFFTRA